MKIGIVSIGNDSLELFRFLHKYDHEYHVYYDADMWPLGDKSFEVAKKAITDGIQQLVSVGVDVIIAPPSWELFLDRSDAEFSRVLPLFHHYLTDYCFAYSLVGKIGLLCDPLEKHDRWGQGLLDTVSKSYSLKDNQKNIESFHFPFAFWSKDVRMRKYFLRSLQPRNYLINKVVKFDLKYFRDAMVDTLVPLNYAFFSFEKTIKRYFNFKKQRFHDLACLEKVFLKLVSDESSYGVFVYGKGDKDMLFSRKRYVWLLQRGKEYELERKQLDE